jgi:hypothetical protein
MGELLTKRSLKRAALEALRKAGWDVFSIAEEYPGVSDEVVAALCAEEQRILLTFDKDFGEPIFRRGLPAGSGVVLFRITPEIPRGGCGRRGGAGGVPAGSSRVFLRSHAGPNSHSATQSGFRRLTAASGLAVPGLVRAFCNIRGPVACVSDRQGERALALARRREQGIGDSRRG